MSSRSWVGLILVLFGGAFLLQQANIFDFTSFLSTWWPLVFIIIGIIQMSQRGSITVIPGLLFIFIGVLLIANQWLDTNLWTYLWPLLLIFIGLSFIFSRSRKGKAPNDENHIRSISIFSGADLRNRSTHFRGGQVTTLFGGAEIDLRKSIMQEDGASLDITSIFGGATVIVPENVKVIASGIPIFGGWEDKTIQTESNGDAPILNLNCHVIFGGVEIKN